MTANRAGLMFATCLCLLFCWPGADESIGAPPPEKRPLSPIEKLVLENTHTVTLDELTFTGPVGTKLKRMDAAARKLAQPGWYHKPYFRIRNHPPYLARWCSCPDHYNSTGGVHQHPGNRPLHLVQLSANFNRGALRHIRGLSLNATWMPAADGWAARVYYSTHAGKALFGEHFFLEFFYNDNPSRKRGIGQRKLAINGVRGSYQRRHRFADTEYEIAVAQQTDDHPHQVVADDQVVQILASAEAMRDFGLAQLEDLESTVVEQIEAGKAIRVVTAYDLRRRGEPPPRVLPGARPLTDAQQQQVLRETRTEFASQRQLLREHYQEMYAAVRNAFPLVECLKGPPERAN